MVTLAFTTWMRTLKMITVFSTVKQIAINEKVSTIPAIKHH